MDTPSWNEAAEPRDDPGAAPAGAEEGPGGAPFPVVGVGASAGGLEAFTQLLSPLPVDTGMAFVLVQHLDPRHESQLGELLSRTTRMPVREAEEGMAVQPDHVYVIPPNTNLTLAQGRLALAPRGETPGLHLPIDVFFRSLAHEQRAAAIGVVLSGTGSDGALGLAEIKAAGGITFAQDEASAPHAGMPHSAIAGGAVDFVLPPAAIAQELARIGRHPYLAPAPAESPPLRVGTDAQFRQIIALLRAASGVDFSQYRDTTIKRRIMRRLALHPADTPAEYIRRLETDRAEIDALYQDLLINVTRFFRDPELFAALRSRVFPAILAAKAPGAPIRLWVPGCSTGQEAYSLAIALIEFLDDQPLSPSIQIFASDLDDAVSLPCARAGLYSETIAAEVSPARLRRFFTQEEGGYRINQSVRERCVFARQNVAADPPFSRVDLISCRNVLIYMAPSLQQRVIPTFHYALNATGFLVLGASETVGGFTGLFEEVDRQHKIYARKAAVGRPYPHFSVEASPAAEGAPGGAPRAGPPAPAAADFQREADRIALGRYAPVGVLVNDQLEILQFRGRTSPYLEPAPGEASFHLLKMAREGLFVPLRSALDAARAQGEAVRQPGVRVRDGEQTREVDLVVIPVRLPTAGAGCFLVLFEAAEAREASGERGDAETAGAPAKEGEVAQLRTELAAAREYLQSIIERQDATNEELRSASEEILSSNEELQSTNEELQTAKEELQSVNEELTTVNDQLQHRNAELNRLYDDLTNLLGSAGIPLVMLGPDLHVRRFTAAAARLLNLQPTDVGRPIGHLQPAMVVPDLETLLLAVIATVQVVEREVRDPDGRWYTLRVHPYRTADHKIDGAVVVLLDIDAVKRAQVQLREARDYAQAIVETVREPLVVLGADLRVVTANQSFYATFQASPEETERRRLDELGSRQWDLPELRALLEAVLSQNRGFEAFAVEREFPGLGARSMRLNARLLRREDNQPPLILLAIEDVTERQRAEAAVAASELRYRRLFESARDGVLILDPGTRKITDVNPFMTELLGYPREELLGTELWEIGLLQDQEASQAAFRELQENGYLRYEDLPLVTRGGERRDVEVVSNLYREDGHDVIQCNIRDITARKRAERLAEQQAEALQEADRRKDNFLAMLAHELRNPLGPIRNAAQLLQRQGSEAPPARRAREIIERQVSHQAHLLDDLLDVTRITRGSIRLQFEPLDLAQLVRSTVEDHRGVLEAAGLTLSLELPAELIRVQGDPTRLAQALGNLLQNAAKFTDRGGSVSVGVQAFGRSGVQAFRRSGVQGAPPRSGGPGRSGVQDPSDPSNPSDPSDPSDPSGPERPNAERPNAERPNAERPNAWPPNAVITVRDTGMGIDPEVLPHVFEMFAQADRSLDRNRSGLGLGLALVKGLVELHGGAVRVESEGPGHGCAFTLTLPILDVGFQIPESSTKDTKEHETVGPAGGAPEERLASSGPLRASSCSSWMNPKSKIQNGKRVLIVEDNRDAAETLREVLEDSGHTVAVAYSGSHAVQAAEEFRPEVVLCDLGLPGMDGYQVAAALRQNPATAGVRLIALSGYGRPEDQQHTEAVGFEQHLVKPVELAELERLLAEGAG